MDERVSAEAGAILQEQIAYYRARAGEYDEWFLRQGRFDHGPELNRLWFDEIEEVRAALDRFRPAGRVLELAGGTGIWTERLAHVADHLTVVDAAPEVLEINRRRLKQAVPDTHVRYLQRDLFSWQPDGQYDVVFFSFWLSHVPPERFQPFWEMVRRALAPGGRAFFVDSLYNATTTASNHRLEGREATTMTRILNDGQQYRIVKVFYEPATLNALLEGAGWQSDARATANYFLYGSATPRT